MVVLIATVAIGLYLLLSVLLGGWPGSRFNRERFLLGCLAGIFLAQFILYGVGVGLGPPDLHEKPAGELPQA